jgi:hypothetical protein
MQSKIMRQALISSSTEKINGIKLVQVQEALPLKVRILVLILQKNSQLHKVLNIIYWEAIQNQGIKKAPKREFFGLNL